MLKISGMSLKQSPMSSGAASDSRIVAESSAQHLPEIALLGLGGNAGGWAGPLAVDDYHGSFHHGGEAEALAHQGKAAAGGGAHGRERRHAPRRWPC